MNILVFGGCHDKKMLSKIRPLLESDLVEKLYLIRESRMEYSHPKLVQYPPNNVIRKIIPLREIYRFLLGLYITAFAKIDVVIGIHFVMHGVYAYLLGTLFRKKYIHLLIENPEQYRSKSLLKLMLKKSFAIAVRGNNSKKYLEDLGINPSLIFNPPNEFRIPSLKPKRFSEKKYDILFIGHFIDRKGIPLWLDIFRKLSERSPDLKGVMLGEGPMMDEVVKIVRDENLKIDILGQIPDVDPVINDSKILLITSKSEGLPMVAVEAISLGLPVISSNAGDIKDVITSGDNGYVIETRDAQDYAKVIDSLLGDEKKYKSFSEKSLEIISKMEKESSIQNLVKLWNKILTK
ncbi:MAG TPA: glycosyltransferase family 4 protein [Candidatus Dojkabacteria bacterium]|nr:glycosyltransferase family 4 protein [Candidatus Dojkabacteria bacterium]